MVEKSDMTAELPRFVFERLKTVDAVTFKRVLCALLERSFSFEMPFNFSADEMALYMAYKKYFPRLSPPLAKEMPLLPVIKVADGKCTIETTEDIAHLRYFVSDRKKACPKDVARWEAYPLDEANAEDSEYKGFDVEYGDTIHAVAIRDGLCSFSAIYEVKEDDVAEE